MLGMFYFTYSYAIGIEEIEENFMLPRQHLEQIGIHFEFYEKTKVIDLALITQRYKQQAMCTCIDF